MITEIAGQLYPSAQTLVNDHAASRVHAKDATLYGFSEEAFAGAAGFMGWTDLASNPPSSLAAIEAFAADARAMGVTAVILAAMGGSSQAPLTVTEFKRGTEEREGANVVSAENEAENGADDDAESGVEHEAGNGSKGSISVMTLDFDSPVVLRETLAKVDPRHTLVIIASKSGSTIEPQSLLHAIRAEFAKVMPCDEIPRHLIAITDPGSDLEAQATEEGWKAVFRGVDSVGGRFSALSVFGLVPYALAGIDLEAFVAHAAEAERLCSRDISENPAIGLAAFLYDNYLEGRDKFSFLAPERTRVLGPWIEQLVAESVGKHGKGILPSVETDPLLLADDRGDRTVIAYRAKSALWDEWNDFERGLTYIDPSIPMRTYTIDSVNDIGAHFVMWEYAIAMLGYLMKVCPFDQPDVASAKAKVREILREGESAPDFVQDFSGLVTMGPVEGRVAPLFQDCRSVKSALVALLGSLQEGDYFAINAFVPFAGEGRADALEDIRHSVAESFGVVSSLEVGPRYLHSTGQLQKGGANNGVFLILSAEELNDIALKEAEAPSLGTLAKAQATGDFIILAERGRRVVHLHLPDNTGITLRYFAEIVRDVLETIDFERALEFEGELDRESN